jgi:ubiquitin carboxyl-terminal hydrolase 14
MKPVTFQSVFDAYEFCSDKVKKVLKVSRDKAAQEEEDRVAKKLRGEDVDDNGDEKKEGESDAAAKTEKTAEVDESMDDELKAALAMSVEPQSPVGPGLSANFQGLYELFAVVTHKGRDADGGHYMGWVKADNSGSADKNGKREKIGDTDEDNDDWFVFDDDEVSPCKTEDILKLKGGGDWHMSYLNFYRAKK